MIRVKKVKRSLSRQTITILHIEDEYTQSLCCRIKNETICAILASFQLIITVASLAQHAYSISEYNKVLYCRFVNGTTADLAIPKSTFLQADIIIFDFGLFHRMLGVEKCVANYLDDGYMRGLWCLGQTCSLLLLLLVTVLKQPHPILIWPALLTENFYVLGLTIWTLATLKKFVLILIYALTVPLFSRMLLYWIGTIANFFFNLVLWHYYWYIEAQHNSGWVQPAML